MVASAVLVECARGVNLEMASADVEAAQLFLRRQDVAERRLQRLVKSSDLKKVGLQEGLRMCEEEIEAVEKSKAVDMTDQLERLWTAGAAGVAATALCGPAETVACTPPIDYQCSNCTTKP